MSVVRSKPTLLSPQTIRRAGPWLARARIRPVVSRSLAATMRAGFGCRPGWTSAMLTVRAAGLGAVSAKATGPAATATSAPATPISRGASVLARIAITIPVLAADQREGDQPDAADGGQREDRGMLPLADPEHRPRAAEALPGPQPLGHQPRARYQDQRRRRLPGVTGGVSVTRAASPTPPNRAPSTMATSSRPGPRLGASQYMAASR